VAISHSKIPSINGGFVWDNAFAKYEVFDVNTITTQSRRYLRDVRMWENRREKSTFAIWFALARVIQISQHPGVFNPDMIRIARLQTDTSAIKQTIMFYINCGYWECTSRLYRKSRLRVSFVRSTTIITIIDDITSVLAPSPSVS